MSKQLTYRALVQGASREIYGFANIKRATCEEADYQSTQYIAADRMLQVYESIASKLEQILAEHSSGNSIKWAVKRQLADINEEYKHFEHIYEQTFDPGYRGFAACKLLAIKHARYVVARIVR